VRGFVLESEHTRERAAARKSPGPAGRLNDDPSWPFEADGTLSSPRELATRWRKPNAAYNCQSDHPRGAQ
jgi:hypothetical protein